MIKIEIKDYQYVTNSSILYAICKLIRKQFEDNFEIELFANERNTIIKTIEYEKTENVVISKDFSYVILKKFRKEQLNERDYELLDDTYPAEFRSSNSIYLGIDPYILLDVVAIIKLLTDSSVHEITADIETKYVFNYFDDVIYYVPKDRIAPLIVQYKSKRKYFSIIAPKLLFK
ncbi:MAG: hypothetical protein Q9M37_03510 [Desulfonauticus sp.]|nr:hypothetical protein [Desulfonauticus sp.]